MDGLSNKKMWMLLLITVLLISSLFYSVHNITARTPISSKTYKSEEIQRKKMDYVTSGYQHPISRSILWEVCDNQLLSDTELDIMLINLKNILIIISIPVISLIVSSYFLKWIISDPNVRIPSFIMHFLQLKDGKKEAASYLISS